MNTILEKIANAKALDFGTIFSESIELYKKAWLQGFLMQLFILLILMPIIIVAYIPFIGVIIAQQQNGFEDNQAMENFISGMSIPYIIFVLVGVVVLGTIAVAINAGFYRILKKVDQNETVETKDFFFFVKSAYLTKVFLIMLVSILIAVPSALLCYLPLIYTIVPLTYFSLIFAFNPELSVGQIVSLSFKLGNKKWLISFGLIFVSSICIVTLSMLTCGLGSLFLQSFQLIPMYLIYKNVIGFNGGDVIDEIGAPIE